jgi:hypothetical protein
MNPIGGATAFDGAPPAVIWRRAAQNLCATPA